MKRFTVPCDFGGKRSPFQVYVGQPNPKNHPLHFQADWLAKARGGSIPAEVMDSFDKLHKISIEQGVSFEELCVYALGQAQENNEKKKKAQQAGAQAGAQANAKAQQKPPQAKPGQKVIKRPVELKMGQPGTKPNDADNNG